MQNKRLLLLFVRNPELGKVKTRLAASIGPEKALEVYLKLLQHTKNITQDLDADKVVYYAERMAQEDLWTNDIYRKGLQLEGELGEKMEAAFVVAFAQGYTGVIIIGSDCPQLTQDLLEQAFEKLQTHDVVLGPAVDGGYYLLGMKKLQQAFFQNKRWSTEHVFADTMQDVARLQLSCFLLPRLTDIDHVEDLGALGVIL